MTGGQSDTGRDEIKLEPVDSRRCSDRPTSSCAVRESTKMPVFNSYWQAGHKSSSGKFAEIDTDECFKADKSQGRFRRIIDF